MRVGHRQGYLLCRRVKGFDHTGNAIPFPLKALSLPRDIEGRLAHHDDGLCGDGLLIGRDGSYDQDSIT